MLLQALAQLMARLQLLLLQLLSKQRKAASRRVCRG
jgi:hypothetical protein